MRHFILTVFALAMLVGCQSARPSQPPSDAAPFKLSPAMVEKVKTAVAKSLKDPESARFNSPFVASKNSKGITVCGFVNAKNSYGGYTGDKPFLVGGDGDLFTMVSVGGTEIETASTMEVCRNEAAEPIR